MIKFMDGMKEDVNGRYTMPVSEGLDLNVPIMKRSVVLFVLACICVAISCAAQTVMKDVPQSDMSHAADTPLTPVLRHPQLDRSYWGIAHAFHRSGNKRRNRGCDHRQPQERNCPAADKQARDLSNTTAASAAA